MPSSDRLLLFCALALAVLVVDWGSKFAAEQLLEPGVVIYNPKPPAWWVIPVAAVATALMLWVGSGRLIVVALGVLTGGWLANFADRVAFGPVVDFIPLPEISGTKYVANLADVAIAVGCVLMLIYLVRLIRSHRLRRLQAQTNIGPSE